MATLEERIKKIDDYRERKAKGLLTVGETLQAKMLKQQRKMSKMYGLK